MNRLGGMLAGTRLLTPAGYRPVETLRRGDSVATLIGRGPMFVPIAWIGRRNSSAAEPDNPDAAPVRIRRHAVGDAMPNRDLLLAPDHALYLRGALYLARSLVNNASIAREWRQPASGYWGVGLERHDVLAAENLAVESQLPASATAFTAVAALRPPGAGEPTPGPDALLAPGWLDIAQESRAVLDLHAALAAGRGVRLQFAAETGLVVRMSQGRLHDLLGAALTHAIHAGSGRVLVVASRHAGCVQIAITDEGGGTDLTQQQTELRAAELLAAEQGATLAVEARPGEGTTILLRLLAAGPEIAPAPG